MPTISIALPVYNAGRQLRPAVQSVINQSFTDWELLLFDDKVTDGCFDTISDLVCDPRIRLVRDGANMGLARRLNQAIDMATGEFFARMDHDDISHPLRLERQLAFLREHPDVDLLATGCVTIDAENHLLGHLPLVETHEQLCRRPWLGFYLPHPTWMARTDWFRNNKYSPSAPYFCEDQELLLRSYVANRYHVLPEFLLAYRVRTNPPLLKTLKTRRVLAGLQAHHFVSRDNWTFAGLSLGSAAARMASDCMKSLQSAVFPMRSRNGTSLDHKTVEDWEGVIAKIIASSDRGEYANPEK
jgi:glycosyltransferase involved in cell wall biosynthesis